MTRIREKHYAFNEDAKVRSLETYSPYASQIERLVGLLGGNRRAAKILGINKRDLEKEIRRGTVKDWRWIRIIHVARLDGVFLFDHVFDPRPMRFNYRRQEWEL